MKEMLLRCHVQCFALIVLFRVWMAAQNTFATETSAASPNGGDPMAILDGDETTSWEPAKAEQSEITVDLGHPWPVRSVEIQWGKHWPSEYEVQLTADGEIWTTVAHPLDFKPSGSKAFEFTEHKVEPEIEAGQLRIRCLTSGQKVQIRELHINGDYPFCYDPLPANAVCLDTNAAPEERVRDMLLRMTVREKIGLTCGFNSFYIAEYERFGFAPVLMSDAAAGLRVHQSLPESTSFPCAMALAATWQPELGFTLGKAIGEECRANGTGILLGPGVNMYRTATCGRNFEYMGEDPWLSSRMVTDYIRGVQSEKVISTVKHFICNNNEFVRCNCNAVIGERALHEIYLPAFAAAVQEGNARAVMSSYNWLNGEKCGENRTLLTDILRGELGFTGMVMSDWDGTKDMTRVLDSGQNIIMPQMKTFGRYVRSRLKTDPAGTEKQLDAMIAPTLRVLFEMGTWDRKPAADPAFMQTFAAHKTVARTIAESAITLLKNDGVLPLHPGQTLLLTGASNAVFNSNSGHGSGYVHGYDLISFYDGLKAVFGNAVTYEEHPSEETAKKADRILYFFNTGDREGSDRPFDLPEPVNSHIEKLASENPNVIVIASTGGGFGMPWLSSVKGLVMGYYLGQEYGAAMANVLSGKTSPSGKLPFTIEKSFSDSPAYGYNLINGQPWWQAQFPADVTNKMIDVRYSEGISTGYRWYETKDKPINFPFGFGLSYTTFRISNLKLSANTITKDSPVTVSVTVQNTGSVPGAEVVQLYVHDDHPAVEMPYRELKGFQKIFLDPGENKTVTVPLDWKALAFWDANVHAWHVLPGSFTLLIGNSSRDVRCQARITYR